MAAILKLSLLVGVVASIGSAACAQTPRMTTATYDDWTETCVMTTEPKGKSCNVAQGQIVQGQLNSSIQIVFQHADQPGSLKMLLSIPANVWIRSGVKLRANDDEADVTARFQWCIPQRCYAEGIVNPETVAVLLSPTASAKLEFKDAAQKEVTVPVSLKGFGDAMNAMAKE